MARWTAEAMSATDARSNVSVSKPWLKAALGAEGASARAARTAANTMAWRKIGTGVAEGVRVTMSVFPSGAHAQGSLINEGSDAPRSGVRGVAAGTVGEGAGLGAAVTCAGRGLGFGTSVALAVPAGDILSAFGWDAQPPESKEDTRRSATRTLLAMSSRLSCAA